MNEIIYSDNAERAVLGALIVNPDMIREIDLRPDDFYVEKNRIVWLTLSGLSARGIVPDYVTLTSSLEKQGKFEEIGGNVFLSELVQSEGLWTLAPQYAMTVRDYGRRRRALQAASKLATLAYDLKAKFDEGISNIVYDITMDVSIRHGADQAATLVDNFFSEVQELIANPRSEVWGMPTGIYEYDRLTGGLQDKDGEVLFIAGEPAVGKSILTMQIGVHLAMSGYPGVIYSLEMRNRQVIRRIVSALSRVDTRKLKTGRMDQDEINRFIAECEKLSGTNLFVCDESQMTVEDLRADIARLKARYGIRWFVLDYLYLLSGGDGMSENDKTTMFSRNVKSICKDFQVAGITVSSVNKQGMDGQTQKGKSTMRGSGQQIHDADVIVFIREHQPRDFEIQDEHIRTLTIEKGRELDHPGRSFNLYKHDGYPLFENVTSKDLNR